MRFRSLFQPVRRPFRWPAPPKRKSQPLRCERLDDRWLPSFLEPVSYPVGTYPTAITTGDFNNDGLTDLVTANRGWSNESPTVSLLLGNADGSFQPARDAVTTYWSSSIAVGDFNSDGKLDIVTGSTGGYYAELLLGRGDGTTQAPSTINLSGYSQSISVGDLNNDGKLDICAVWHSFGYYGDTYAYTSVILGTGTGTFTGNLSSWLGYGYHTSAALADFNGDGKLDIAATNYNGQVNVALGFGTGNFDSPNSFQASNAYYDNLTVIADDLNNDGHLDLATTAPSIATVNVLLGNGTGQFTTRNSYPTGLGPRSLATADFNNDDNPDLIAASSGTISVMLGDGEGAFETPIQSISTFSPLAVVVGDFNGDGLPDAATADQPSADLTVNTASVFINDGDWTGPGVAGLTINDVTVTEGNTGTTNATFNITLSVASTEPVTVQYATHDVNTTAGVDYQSTAGTLTFAPGETSKSISIAVLGDRTAEWNESFHLVLTNPTNAFLADGSGIGLINDDEPQIYFDFGPVYVTEGNTGTRLASFTVRMQNAYDVPVDVNYSVAEGDTRWWEWGYYYAPPAATAGSDFAAGNGTITFSPGETEKIISVPVFGDRVAEWNEHFSVDLTGSNHGRLMQDHAVGVILDDEPYVYVDYPDVMEGNSGTANMIFTITLSNASDLPVTVNYATRDGTAVVGSDYHARSGTVTFAPGETTKTVAVPVIGDRIGEPNEFIALDLSDAVGANVTNSVGYGYILNDEPWINIESAQIVEGNSGTRLMTFTVYLSAAYDQTITVKYKTENGTAKVSDKDYNAASGTLTFLPGQTTKTFTVTIRGDTKKEVDEYFYAVLHSNSTNSQIEYDSAVGVIIDDDARRGRRP
jgi:hypothetical protein